MKPFPIRSPLLLVILSVCALFHASVMAQYDVEPQPSSGRIERLAQFASKHVDARHVDVWLPDNYDALKAAGQRFNVIYMHDGQMLFDAKTT